MRALPITPTVLVTLRETARLFTAHYSTMIEGKRLTQEQVIEQRQHLPGRDRDESEVLGYYAALERVERLANIVQRRIDVDRPSPISPARGSAGT